MPSPAASTSIQVYVDLAHVVDPIQARRLAFVLFGNPTLAISSIVGSST